VTGVVRSSRLGVRRITAVSGWEVDASDVALETSLSLILETTSREREARASLLESIDARAGVLLGFAAALAALAPRDVNMVVEVGRIIAVLGGLAALFTFWPREQGILDVDGLIEFATAEIVFTRQSLAVAQTEIVLGLTELLVKKIRRLRVGMISIGCAALSIATGLALD
jgi:non-ribosomal peptide synthetase component F